MFLLLLEGMSFKNSEDWRRQKYDRLSALPDAVLCHILSFLPMKYVVATSILSTRWKYLYMSVPVIELDDTVHSQEEEESQDNIRSDSFRRFADRVLMLRNADIIQFHLKCTTTFESSVINAWLCAVLLHKVQVLNLFMKYDNPRCLTSELFTCKTLQWLNLDSSIIIKPKLVHLPNLKILRLFGVELTDDGSIPQILAGCPKLEHLHMCGCQLHGIQVLDISTPSLKSLEFFNCYGAFRVVIDTPNLEDLCYVDFLNGDPLVKNLKSLVKAYLFPYSVTLQNTDDACLCGGHVSKFLNAMANTKSLTLLTVCLEGLLHSGCSIPKFQNLTYMKLVPRHNCHWELLPILLHSTPNLKTLALDMEFPDNDIRQWPKFPVTQNQPICLAQYLRTVDIFNFKGMQFELDLLSYLLQYGQVLEKINLIFSQNNGFSNWSDAVRKISALPKTSSTCQLEFLCTSKNTFCKPVCLTSIRS